MQGMKRRPKGEGSIQRLPNGTYKMTITIGRTPDGKQRRKSVSAKTKSALMKLVSEVRLSTQGTPSTPITLKEVYEAYMKEHGGTLAFNTLASWETIRKHLKSIEHLRMDKITPEMLDATMDNLKTKTGKTYKASSIAEVRGKIATLFNFAVNKGVLSSSPVKKTKRRRSTHKANLLVIPSELEIQRLLKELKERDSHFLYPVCLLAVTSGMRMGEILGLEVTDIDTKTSSIHIKHQATYEGFRKPLKTIGSHRTIYVHHEVLEIILKERPKDSSKVFDISSYRAGSQRLAKALRGISWLPTGFTFHCFRHYHATQLLLKGIDVKEVSKRLGHSQIETTLNLYVHWMPEVDQKASRLIGDQFII